MNIREWFGMIPYSEKTEAQCALDRVLTLHREALVQYLSVDDRGDIYDLIRAAKITDKNSGDVLFLDWLIEKGLTQICSLDFSKITDQEKFIAMVDLDEFVLQNEMDFLEPNEVRGCIISFLSDLKWYPMRAGGGTNDQSDH
ncbi:hypothetical protein ACPJHH_13100 [Bacillus altitudinis]|uniref:hypothetical protein n=1 Tax=Bacillus altitudinis TaxID=293387 RepID=UPI003D14A2C5